MPATMVDFGFGECSGEQSMQGEARFALKTLLMFDRISRRDNGIKGCDS